VSCLPPPVSTALILTQVIEGNVPAALFNSALGSFLGVIVTPVLLMMTVGVSATVPLSSIFVKLGSQVLLPMLAGQGLRYLTKPHLPDNPNRCFNTFNNLPFSHVAKIMLMLIIYNTFCDTFSNSFDVSITTFALLATGVACLQLTLMAIVFRISPRLGFNRSDTVAQLFVCTHKSLTLGLPLVNIIFAGDHRLSLIVLPLLCYHPLQIMLGSFLSTTLISWKNENTLDKHILPAKY